MVGFGICGHIVAMISHEFCGDRTSLVWLDWSKQDSNVLEVLADSILPYSGLIELVLGFFPEPGCFDEASRHFLYPSRYRNGRAREVFVSVSFTLLKLKQSGYADLFVCFALSYLNGRL